jgi:3-hydroxybutyryl-CoA dehydrogenase
MPEKKNIAVIGAGLMGHGIAQSFAQKGWAVGLYDLNDDILAKAMDRVGDNLRVFVEMGLESEEGAVEALKRITPTTDLAQAVMGADLVMEAAPENLELKRGLFREIDRHARPRPSWPATPPCSPSPSSARKCATRAGW